MTKNEFRQSILPMASETIALLARKSLSLLLFLIYLCGLTLDFIITDKRVSRNMLGVIVVLILGLIFHKIMIHG